MRFPVVALLGLLSLSALAAQSEPAPELVRVQVAEAPAASGPRLSATFRELDRQPAFSVAELAVLQGSSDAASLFALRGACAVLQARAALVVAIERISGRPALYRLSFPKEAPAEQLSGPAKSAFTAQECALLPS